MVIKCAKPLRARIFKFTKNLKDKKNSRNQKFYVDPQLPEKKMAERRNLNYQMATLRKENSLRTPENQAELKIEKGKIYVNKEKQKTWVYSPKVSTILNLSREEYDRIECLEMVKSAEKEESASKFTVYAKKVQNVNQIADYYQAVKIWHPEADSIVAAYSVKSKKGNCDDSESGAGLRIQKLIEERNEKDVVVFVAREYGGRHLGTRRFRIITDQAREVLNKL